MSQKPVLYGAILSPFVRKVKVMLMEKGIEHDNPPVSPFDENPDFKKVSPLGKIPAFVDDQGRAVNDSSVIAAFIEARYPEKALYPQDIYERAQACWFEEYADSVVAGQMVFAIFGNRIVRRYLTKNPIDEKLIEGAYEAAPAILDYLTENIKGQEYFVGNTFSIADISLACMFINLHYADFTIDSEKYPELTAWLERVWTRPAFAELRKVEEDILGKIKANNS